MGKLKNIRFNGSDRIYECQPAIDQEETQQTRIDSEYAREFQEHMAMNQPLVGGVHQEYAVNQAPAGDAIQQPQRPLKNSVVADNLHQHVKNFDDHQTSLCGLQGCANGAILAASGALKKYAMFFAKHRLICVKPTCQRPGGIRIQNLHSL